MVCKHRMPSNPLAGMVASLRCPRCRAERHAAGAVAMALRCRRTVAVERDGLGEVLGSLGLDQDRNLRARVESRARLRKVSRYTSAAIGSLFLLLGGWSVYIEMPPNVAVASPNMPRNNAFDTLAAASESMVAAGAVSAATDTRRREPAESAKTVGMSVLSLDQAQLSTHVFTPEDRRQLLAANRETLATVRRALAQEYMEPPARSYSHVFPNYAKDRELARMLAMEAEVRRADGDYAGSLSSSLDAIVLGTRIPRGGPLIGKLVGVACESIGRASAWQVVANLSAEQARAGARRLEALAIERITMSDTMREEMWMGQAGLQEIMAKPGWRMHLLADFTGGGPDGVSQGPGFRFLQYAYLFPRTKRSLLDEYTTAMQRNIMFCSFAWSAQRRYADPDPATQGILERILMPVYSHASFADLNSEAANRLLLVALALHAYHQERHAYPQTLAELVPRYLRKVPIDPFATDLRAKLCYALQGDRYLLYSIGPNGNDDGGSPAIDLSQNANEYSRYHVTAESQGDIVAGINTK